jgi:hypothetical protein
MNHFDHFEIAMAMFNYQRVQEKQIFRVNPSLADFFHNSLREIINKCRFMARKLIYKWGNYADTTCVYIYSIIIHNSLAKVKKTRFWHSCIAISQSKKTIKSQVRGGVRSGLLSGLSCNNSNNSSIAA